MCKMMEKGDVKREFDAFIQKNSRENCTCKKMEIRIPDNALEQNNKKLKF